MGNIRSEGDTSQTANLLCIVTQAPSKTARAVLLLVKKFDCRDVASSQCGDHIVVLFPKLTVLPQNGLKAE